MSLMRTRVLSWPLSILLAATVVSFGAPMKLLAQDVASEEEALAGSFEEVPEYIKTGQYNRAIAILHATIEGATQADDIDTLRLAYLLLIKTYIIRYNYFFRQDRAIAQLHHNEAESLTRECLQIHDLRHTVPDPPEEYPTEMLELFDEVRGQIFGSFRVIQLEPAEATVYLDGEMLGTYPGESYPGDVNIPVGTHTVVVQSEGFDSLSDAINISPGATLEKSYLLAKHRGTWWWLTRGSLTVVGVTGAVLGVLAVTGGETPPPEPLPPPPDPPRR